MTSYKGFSDEQLVLAYQQTKASAAFSELYQRYNQKVFLYCAKILGDREDAMDLTQDLFVKISDRLMRLKDPVAFVKWIFRIAHNDCMDLLKKNKKQQSDSIDNIIEPEADIFDEQEAISEDIALEQMQLAFLQLPDAEKNFLSEKYLEGKSIQNLMDKYGLTKSAVKMRLARSRGKVRASVVF